MTMVTHLGGSFPWNLITDDCYSLVHVFESESEHRRRAGRCQPARKPLLHPPLTRNSPKRATITSPFNTDAHKKKKKNVSHWKIISFSLLWKWCCHSDARFQLLWVRIWCRPSPAEEEKVCNNRCDPPGCHKRVFSFCWHRDILSDNHLMCSSFDFCFLPLSPQIFRFLAAAQAVHVSARFSLRGHPHFPYFFQINFFKNSNQWFLLVSWFSVLVDWFLPSRSSRLVRVSASADTPISRTFSGAVSEQYFINFFKKIQFKSISWRWVSTVPITNETSLNLIASLDISVRAECQTAKPATFVPHFHRRHGPEKPLSTLHEGPKTENKDPENRLRWITRTWEVNFQSNMWNKVVKTTHSLTSSYSFFSLFFFF